MRFPEKSQVPAPLALSTPGRAFSGLERCVEAACRMRLSMPSACQAPTTQRRWPLSLSRPWEPRTRDKWRFHGQYAFNDCNLCR